MTFAKGVLKNGVNKLEMQSQTSVVVGFALKLMNDVNDGMLVFSIEIFM